MLFQTMMPVLPVEDGVILSVKVTPKAAHNRIVGIDAQGLLKVTVTAVPENGKANAAVCALLAKDWKLSKTSFTVIEGTTCRVKKIHIKGSSQALMALLRTCF